MKSHQTVVALDQLKRMRDAATHAANERAMGVRMTLGGWAAQMLAGSTPNRQAIEDAVEAALDLWAVVNVKADERAHLAQSQAQDAKPTPPVPSVISAP